MSRPSYNFRVYFSVAVLVALIASALLLISPGTEAQQNRKTSSPFFARTESHADGLENYDIRTDKKNFPRLASFRSIQGVAAFEVADIKDSLVLAEESFEARYPGSDIETRPTNLGPEVIGMSAISPVATLTKPSKGNRAEILKQFLSGNSGLVGVSSMEISQLEAVADYSTLQGEIGYVILTQKLEGIPVFQGEVKAGFTKRGEIIRIINNLAPGIGGVAIDSDFGSPELAVSYAFGHINRKPSQSDLNLNESASDASSFVFGDGDSATTSEKVYFPTEPGVVVAAWQVLIWQPTNAYYVIVDAKTGTLLWRKNITEDQTQSATYGVYRNPNAMIDVADSPFPLTPGPTSPNGTQGPGISRTILSRIGNEGVYSFNLLGFLPDGVQVTDGNYVQAGIDRDGTDGVDPDGEAFSATRSFVFNYNPWNPNTDSGDLPVPETQTYPPSEFQQGTVTQMFWVTSWVMSELYRLGFNEQSRNFQNDNFGRGGSANDRIRGEGQDRGPLTADPPANNANFSTPADGGRPRMQMYNWTAGGTVFIPRIDGNLDADVIIHEIVHGLSNRLIGNSSGLSTNMSRGMGEGWSDFYAHAMLSESSDPINGIYTTGGYDTFKLSGFFLNNYYYGIRRFPKAVMSFTGGPNNRPHNPLTFADIDATQINTTDGAFSAAFNSSFPDQVHAAGEVWSSALWEVRCRLVQRLGWDVGNRRALQLVTDGMKLTPNAPTFLQARDAIVAAARASSLADLEDVWRGFAVRGMGRSARVLVAGGSGTTRVTESFDLPTLLSPQGISFSDIVGGNGNSIPEPGESVVITIPVINENWANATSVTLTVGNGSAVTMQNIASGESTNLSFTYQIPNTLQCGSEIVLNITLDSSVGSSSFTKSFSLGTAQLTFSENFDTEIAPTLPIAWSVTTEQNSPESFATTTANAQSVPNSAFVRNASTVGGGASLISPAIPIQGSGARISFAHRYATETGWDGGVLELSIEDGPFVDILNAGGEFLGNGYNGVLGNGPNNPLANRPAWNGSSNGFITTSVKLPSSTAGKSVKLRWRFGADDNTVGAGANPGWNIDNLEVFGAFSCSAACSTPIQVSIPNTNQFPGSVIEVPINVGDLTGKGVQSYDITVTYNPAIITPASPMTTQSGTLSSAMTVVPNEISSGTMKISAFGTASLSGQGALLKLRFNVIGTRLQSTSIGFSSMKFNEGNPCSTATNGNFVVDGGVLAGSVLYFGNQAAVPEVVLDGIGSINLTRTTGPTGIFSMDGFGLGSYTLTPSKSGGVGNVAISALDASTIAQFSVGLISLTTNQRIAADVTNDGTISALDASRIAQWSVGLQLPAGDLTGTWKFVPGSRTYSTVNAALTAQDFVAILMGDVTGNWTP